MKNLKSTNPLLSVKGIAKSYGHVRALQNIDIDIHSGEVLGLLGDNGAGKSTLIKILSGIVRPDKGQIFREGKEINILSRKDSEEKAGVQTIYQDIALVKSMSILRNIFAGQEGGQAQAVAIARAVHFQRDILLLDEPTSALSVRETNKVHSIMREIADAGNSCVFVTHNLYHAFQVCDRFVVFSHGEVVKSSTKENTSLDELTDLILAN